MPIGKNALKRVTNNGYSNVSVSAPDMEHSTVEVNEEPKKAASNTTKKAPAKAPATKTEKKAAPEKKPAAPKAKKAEEPKAEVKKNEEGFTRPEGFIRFGLGNDLPDYLL